jgi:DNA-binding NtrC family response regulator
MAQRTHVLLVDDDVVVRQSLEQALVLEDFLVVPVGTSGEALREFGERRIDIVLLDLNLGTESGWDTLLTLKRIRPRIPVILMTGHQENNHSVSKNRAEAYMEKPLDLVALFRKLHDLVAQAGAVSG